MSEVKDPNAVLPFVWDWTAWLADQGDDTITAHEILTDGTITVDSTANSATTVTAWLSGGTAGDNILVNCRITTAGGRTDDRSITIMVRDR